MMKTTFFQLTAQAYVLFLILPFSNCQRPPVPFTFVAKNWQLTALQKKDSITALPNEYGFNLRFEDGRITGKGACNYLGFYYQWRYADSISVFGGDQTMMACEPEDRMTWDHLVTAEMLKVRALHWVDSSHLELRCYDGGKIFFTQTTKPE